MNKTYRFRQVTKTVPKHEEFDCEECGYDCSEYPEVDKGIRASLSQLMRSIIDYPKNSGY